MTNTVKRIAVLLAALALLLPGTLVIMSAPEASAAAAYGRVSVSGTNILVDGAVPSEKFFGVVETTALQFAILAYVEGESGVAGKTSHFNGPDTSNQGYISQNSNAEAFWHQYFALCAYYNVNLVRLGAGDTWGSSIQYQAWLNHHDAYINFLKVMCDQAEQHGVWVCLVLAGSQEYPTYQYGGSGSVFDPSSTAYARYIAYCRDTMAALEGENAIAMYDLFNEPDHNNCNINYWNGDKVKFNTWARSVASATAGASTHPRTLGVAGLGSLFGWGKADFDLATGNTGFEILHRHYYASATGSGNTYLFADPESWADQSGKPLFWGELAYNGVYPLIRYTFGEQAIYASGGQAITSMVLTGTSGYPYAGGALPDPAAEPLPELKFTTSAATGGTVGAAYTYRPATSIATTFAMTTDAPFLSISSNGVVSGTPSTAGNYSVRLSATSSDHRTVYQNYTLVVNAPYTPPTGGDTPSGNTTDGGSGGGTGNTTDGSGGKDKPRDNKTHPGNWWKHRTAYRDDVLDVSYQVDQPTTPASVSGQSVKLYGYTVDGGSISAFALAISIASLGALAFAVLIRRRQR